MLTNGSLSQYSPTRPRSTYGQAGELLSSFLSQTQVRLNFAALKLSREQKAGKREGAGNIVMGESTVFNLNDHHDRPINLNSLKSQLPAH